MTKEKLIENAEKVRQDGKIFRCGSKHLEENRTANITANITANLITKAVLTRKQNV